MQDIIHLLPDSVANQIAAGEVVQRPASVVKELMENALDAGATKIQVIVSDGGRTLIQVIDNGSGMSETDARLAFERHATSKISSAEDLFALRTMGFRGEALASIVAVAEVELLTRRAVDELGTRIAFSGSKLEAQEPVMCPLGSNFKIKNLFFNIPARRKFLKSIQSEFNNIVTEFERVALINCDVDFVLTHNDSEVLNLQAGSMRKRILDIFGKKITSQLIEVEVSSSLLEIKGFVGAPESARKKGAQQYFFVNGRYMRHPYFAKAVMEAYSQMIPQGEQVPFFLCFTVDPSRIDVNIHPTKTEIKFEDEQSLWKIIAAAVRESLGRFNAAPGLDFEAEEMPDLPAMNLFPEGAPVQAPRISYKTDYNPFRTRRNDDGRGDNWEAFYRDSAGAIVDPSPFEDISIPIAAPVESQEEAPRFIADDFVPMSQYKGMYILIPVKSGLMWVHQRRAHIRVLYERYIGQLRDNKGYVQGLLFPERLDLSAAEAVALDSISQEVQSLGFEISSLGGGSFSLNGVPVDTEGLSPTELLLDIIHSAMEQTTAVKEKLQHSMALSMATQMAVVAGQVLSFDEMSLLVNELFATSMPQRTPDGATVVYVMNDSEMNKFFAK
jgi:DNA mismatch repair protein MutL